MSDKMDNNESDETNIIEEVSAQIAEKNELGKGENEEEIESSAADVKSSKAVKKNKMDACNNDENPPINEEPKILINVVASSTHDSDEEAEEMKIAQDQLDELETRIPRKKRIKKNIKIQQKDDVDNNEVLTILEGENEGHYEIIIQGNEEDKNKKKTDIDGRVEVKQQRGRKRKCGTDNSSEKLAAKLLNSISSDWNDDLKKEAELPAKKAKKKILNKTKSEIIILEPKKPRRIIKKKIIWDPDVPETHFPLSSLVQASPPPQSELSKGTYMPKRANAVKPKIKSPETKNEEIVVKQKRRTQTPVAIIHKKKKLSETEKSLDNDSPSELQSESKNAQINKATVTKKEPVIKKKDTPKKENVQNRNVILNKKENLASSKKEIAAVTKRETPTLKKQNVASVQQAATKKAVKQSTEIEVALPKKRTPKPKKDKWDYIYNQRNEDSMIIRRRSSSYSSTTSPRRLSVEYIPPTLVPKQTTITKGKGKVENNVAFEFAKPETKSNANKKENDEKSVMALLTVENGMNKKVSSTETRGRKSVRNLNVAVNSSKTKDESDMPPLNNTVVIKKHGNVTQLIVHPKYDKTKHSYSVQILKSLTKNLHALSNDGSCKVVVITSESPNFCQGLDLNYVLNQNAEKRKNASEEMSRSLRDFLKELASFSKPIIAGIQGACVGLGVTMLPLFDVVISSDKCTFDTACAKFGQLPEGYCILSSTNNIRNNFKTRLLWLCEKANATDAALSGLITKLTVPERVQEDTLSCAKKLALSSQVFVAMKSQRIKNELSKLLPAINDEEKILINHWMSAEFQEKIKLYLQAECS